MFEFLRDIQERKKAEQEYKDAVLLSDIITGINKNCEAFTKLGTELEEFAIEAAELGRDEFVDELADTMASIQEFVEELRFLVLKIRVSHLTGKALGSLSSLPKALKSCRSSIGKTLDFSKMGKDMASLMNSLGTARNQLTAFRRSLKDEYKNSKVLPEFAIEEAPKVDAHHAALVNDIKKGIILRIRENPKFKRTEPIHETPVNKQDASRDVNAAATTAAATATDIASMIDDEQGK